MGRSIKGVRYSGPFNLFGSSPIGGSKAFILPDDKTWLITKITTRIITPGSATNMIISIYNKNGVKLWTVAEKGSAPAQTESEEWDEIRGVVMQNEDEIRFLAETADGTELEAILDYEEVDE